METTGVVCIPEQQTRWAVLPRSQVHNLAGNDPFSLAKLCTLILSGGLRVTEFVRQYEWPEAMRPCRPRGLK